MFRRDPVPTALAATGLKHVHGAVYLCGNSMRFGSQSKGQIAPIADLGDHAFTGYSGALYATCKVQSDRERATGMHDMVSLLSCHARNPLPCRLGKQHCSMQCHKFCSKHKRVAIT